MHGCAPTVLHHLESPQESAQKGDVLAFPGQHRVWGGREEARGEFQVGGLVEDGSGGGRAGSRRWGSDLAVILNPNLVSQAARSSL